MVCSRCCGFVTGRQRQAPDDDRGDQAPLIERREAVLGAATAAVAAAVASAEAERASNSGRGGRRSWASLTSSANRSSGRAGAPTSSFQSAVSSEGSLTRRELAAENEALKTELRKSQRRHHKELAKLKASLEEKQQENVASASSAAAPDCNEAGEAAVVASDSLDSTEKAKETRASLLELKEARRSMQGAELARERAEAQLVAMSMEKENLEAMLAVARDSLMSRRSLGVRTDLAPPRPDEIALLRADLAACIPKACAVDETSQTLGQFLEEWASSSDSFGWSAPKQRLEKVGEQLRSSRLALDSCRAALAPLLPRLTQRRLLRVPGPAPGEDITFRKYLEQHLFKSAFGGGLMTRTEWGTVQRGMRLVAMDGRRVPVDASLDSLAEGSSLEVRCGSALSFIGCRPDVDLSLFSDILSLLLRPVDLLLRLRDFSNMHNEGDEDQVGLPPPRGPAPDVSDQEIMDVWQERLMWEAELVAFDREIWHALLSARAVYLAPSFGEEPLEHQEAPGEQAAEGASAATKGKGKGGKGKAKGKGAPPAPKRKAAATGSGGADSDMVERTAVKRKDQPLFGRRTRPPDQAMLAKQLGTFPTFVDKVTATPGVASIRDAFGERGCLLLHACIAEAPGDRRNLGNLGETESAASATHLMQIVRGESGSMGDMRRMDAEIRFRKFAPCGRDCLGRGLVPRSEAPCKVAHELASAVASLDFEALAKAAASADVDLTAFFPVTAVHPLEDDDRAESEKINQAFLTPEEQHHLEAFSAQVLQSEAERDREVGEDEVRIEHLHSLERRLLPFLHVPALPEKVKIHHVCSTYKALADSLLDNYSLAETACQVVQESPLLLDVLAVTLQIASYVKNFGATGLGGQGFSFMKLQYYSGFWIGRHQFLSVLCAFLMNLRPRENLTSKPVAKPGSRNARSQPPANRTTSQVGRSMSQRASSQRGRPNADEAEKGKGKGGRLRRSPSFNLPADHKLTSPGSTGNGATNMGSSIPGSSASIARKGPNFLQLLENDLSPAREAYRRKLSSAQLENQTKQLEHMARFIEKCQTQEVPLFLPRHSSPLPTASDERRAELSAWHAGKERLQTVFDDITASQLQLRNAAESLRRKERELQQFGGVRKDEFETVGYIDIIGSILSFIDALKQRWVQHDNASSEMQELQRTLLAAAPLQMLFSSSCLAEAFDLWRSKAQESVRSGKRMQRWDDDLKHETLKGLFALFDTNADGAVDAEELRVTIQAFGLDLPEDSADLHLQVVRHFDEDGDGKLDLTEFKHFVSSRIRAAFGQFVSASDPSSISENDLRAVATRLDRDGSGDCKDLYARMIGLLDSIESDGTINIEEFEQLVLLAPSTAAVGRISSGHELNWSKNLVRMRSEGGSAGFFTSTSSRIFAWDSEDDKPLPLPLPRESPEQGETKKQGEPVSNDVQDPIDASQVSLSLDLDLGLKLAADTSAPMKEETSLEMAEESTATTIPGATSEATGMGMGPSNSQDIPNVAEVEACSSLAGEAEVGENAVAESQEAMGVALLADTPDSGKADALDCLLSPSKADAHTQLDEDRSHAKVTEPESTPEATGATEEDHCEGKTEPTATETIPTAAAPSVPEKPCPEDNAASMASDPTSEQEATGPSLQIENHEPSKAPVSAQATDGPTPEDVAEAAASPQKETTGEDETKPEALAAHISKKSDPEEKPIPHEAVHPSKECEAEEKPSSHEEIPLAAESQAVKVQGPDEQQQQQQQPLPAATQDLQQPNVVQGGASEEKTSTKTTTPGASPPVSGVLRKKSQERLSKEAESASNAVADEASSPSKMYITRRGPPRAKAHAARPPQAPTTTSSPPTSSSTSAGPAVQDAHQQMREKMARRLAHQKAVQRPSAGFLDEDEARQIAQDIIREG